MYIYNGFKKVAFVFITMLFLFVSYNSIAQAPVFNIKVKLSITDGDLKHAVINVTKNGAPYRVIDPSGGKYSVDLDLNAEYLFTCTKMGYITKSIVVDAHVPKGREQEEFAKFIATITLNPQPEDQEITYSQPVGRIKFSGDVDDFDFDKDYTASAQEMQKKAEANPIPKPKPPTPNPRPTTTKTEVPPLPPSKPIPIEVKQPVYVPAPTNKKPIVVAPEEPPKPIVKNKTEKNYNRDRVKVTIITVNINGVDYEYKREEYDWGGRFFYKNGWNITDNTFAQETQ